MPIVKLNEAELYYEVHGSGEPIVFTHGASWDHRQWGPQINGLAKDYQVIVWDVRGHGQSSLPKGKVDSEDFNKDLIGLMNHLQLKNAHLCGLSMGGHISLQTAIRYPEYVQSLILIGTPFTNQYNWYERIAMPINRWSSWFLPMKVMAMIQGRTLSTFNRENKAYIESAVCMIPLRNWVRIWDAVSRMESGDRLKEVRCPTLILQGDHDNMTKRQQQHLTQAVPESTLVSIKDAHHATNLDNPDQVNEEIRSYLNNMNKE